MVFWNKDSVIQTKKKIALTLFESGRVMLLFFIDLINSTRILATSWLDLQTHETIFVMEDRVTRLIQPKND